GLAGLAALGRGWGRFGARLGRSGARLGGVSSRAPARSALRREGGGRFGRVTDRARRTIVQAQEESRALHHTHSGPEHILLALVREDDGRGSGRRVLADLGITEAGVRDQLGLAVDPEAESPTGHIPFTPQAKKTLELSLREALQLGDSH